MLCAFALLCGGRRWGGKIGRSRLLRIIKQEVCLCAECDIHARRCPAHMTTARERTLAGRCAGQQKIASSGS